MKVVIDGNIGSGKTTQLGLLEQKGWAVHREPIDKWPLAEFYTDPKRWAYLLHMVILQTNQPIDTQEPVIYERSLMSSRYVFWPVLQRKGYVTESEEKSYEAFYEEYAWWPDVYIFLAKDVDTAWSHIQKRHQTGDTSVTFDYLCELEAEYKKLIQHVPCKVYVVNGNRGVDEIHKDILRVLKEHELLVGDASGHKMPPQGRTGRQMLCPYVTDMCSVS